MGLQAYKKVVFVTLTVTLSVVALGATAVAGFYYKQSKTAQVPTNKSAPPEDIIQRVGALYSLPSGEQPTVAQIKHQDKLRDQAFFSNAQDGDSILIYPKAKLAIIYRQSTNKIINAGPVNYSDAL